MFLAKSLKRGKVLILNHYKLGWRRCFEFRYHSVKLLFYAYLILRIFFSQLSLKHGEGNGNLLQYFCLENPRDGGAWWVAVCGVSCMYWRRKWQPTPVFLPGESQGRQSLVGCHLWRRTESDMTEVI